MRRGKPLARTNPMRGARKRINPKRRTPRRGRVVDTARLKWAATQPCQITGRFPATTHHVREYGSQKDDQKIIRLIPELHMHESGMLSIERLGKVEFERTHGRKISEMIAELANRYEQHRAGEQDWAVGVDLG